MMRTHNIVTGLRALRQLDLSQVGRKLMEPAPEGKDWSSEQVAEAEKWYRRYLEICLRYPEFPAVPNAPIDAFWHQHILDTRAYIADCDKIFGEYMHHYPYYGLNGDRAERDDSFVKTNELYQKHFAADCTEMQGFPHLELIGKGCNGTGCCGLCKHFKTETIGDLALQAVGCNSAGSGTGCGQGCRR